MSTDLVDLQAAPDETSPPAPRPAARCRCDAREIIAFRDDDGDWTCFGCGREIAPATTRARSVIASAGHSAPPLG
jgi:hypothetical protein